MQHLGAHCVNFRSIFFIIILIFGEATFFSQTKKNDSLRQVIKTSGNDSNKVNTLFYLVSRFQKEGESDSAIKYLSSSLIVSTNLNFKNGIALSNRMLGEAYLHQNNFSKSLNFLLIALQQYNKLKNNSGIAVLLTEIGVAYMSKGENNKALEKFLLAQKYYLELSTSSNKEVAVPAKKGLANSYTNIGALLSSQGNYSESLINNLLALKINEELGSKIGLSFSYHNLGSIYARIQDDKRAIEYYNKSIQLKKEIKDFRGLASCYNNISDIYLNLGNFTATANFQAEQFKICQKENDQSGLAKYYTGNGNLNEALGDSALQKNNVRVSKSYFAKSLESHLSALAINKGLGQMLNAEITMSNIGGIYIKLNKYNEAIKYFHESLKLSKNLGDREGIKVSFHGLAVIDSVLGKYKSSYNYYKLFIIYRDSLSNEENTKKNVQIQMQYDFDKKQNADSIKNSEKIKQEQLNHEQKIKTQKTYTYGGLAGLLLMMLVAGISFRAFRHKQKANNIISLQKKLVDEKQKEILDSIHYAQRIQLALITSEKQILKMLEKLNKS